MLGVTADTTDGIYVTSYKIIPDSRQGGPHSMVNTSFLSIRRKYILKDILVVILDVSLLLMIPSVSAVLVALIHLSGISTYHGAL